MVEAFESKRFSLLNILSRGNVKLPLDGCSCAEYSIANAYSAIRSCLTYLHPDSPDRWNPLWSLSSTQVQFWVISTSVRAAPPRVEPKGRRGVDRYWIELITEDLTK